MPKDKTTEEILAMIDKKFGDGVVVRYGDTPKEKVEVVSTGCPSLDTALGTGGIPIGKTVEILRPESSGKTTLTLHIMSEFQKKGLKVAFIDTEHALDPFYAQNLGVDMDNVLLSQPDSAEQALEVVDTLINSGGISLIVLDSVAALAPRAMLDGEFGDATIGLVARLLSDAMKKFAHSTTINDCTIIFINQLRSKIGTFGYGPTEGTTGGKALPYQCSVRMEVKRIGSVKGSGETVIGNEVKIRVVKNKLASPYKEAKLNLIFGEGFSKESDLLEEAIKKGVITAKGAWIAFNGTNFAQGKDKARIALKDETFFNEVSEALKQ